jgi:hypothetical protein
MQWKTFYSFCLFYFKHLKTYTKIQTHTYTHLFYYILLTHPTITFLQITEIKNNSNNKLNIYNLQNKPPNIHKLI